MSQSSIINLLKSVSTKSHPVLYVTCFFSSTKSNTSWTILLISQTTSIHGSILLNTFSIHSITSLYLLENFLTIISFLDSNPLLSVSHHQNLCRNHCLQFIYHLMLQSAFLHCKLSGHRAALNFILSSLMITLSHH